MTKKQENEINILKKDKKEILRKYRSLQKRYDKLVVVINQEIPTSWLHPIFDKLKLLNNDTFTPRHIEIIFLRIRENIKELTSKEEGRW